MNNALYPLGFLTSIILIIYEDAKSLTYAHCRWSKYWFMLERFVFVQKTLSILDILLLRAVGRLIGQSGER